MVGFDDEDEAYYFCALLNSSPGRSVAQSYAVHGTGSFGSPHILTNTRILRFSKDNYLHIELSKRSRAAHLAVAANDPESIKQIEEEIDHLSAMIWEINEAKLKEIQWDLADLKASGQPSEDE